MSRSTSDVITPPEISQWLRGALALALTFSLSGCAVLEAFANLTKSVSVSYTTESGGVFKLEQVIRKPAKAKKVKPSK